MLGNQDVVAFVATNHPEQAKAFYSSVLGLRLVSDTPPALVFDAGGTILRVAKVAELTPAPYTVLGWKVADIRAIMRDLANKGITFECYKVCRKMNWASGRRLTVTAYRGSSTRTETHSH